MPRPSRSEVIWLIGPSIDYVPLSKGLYALIDAADIPLCVNRTWTLLSGKGRFYATTGNGAERISMHRMFLNPPVGLTPDHRNGNGLDNRRSNLRPATASQNATNRPVSTRSTTGLKGVRKAGERRQAVITVPGTASRKKLGYFPTKEDAYAAYCSAAREHHGDFARV